MSNLIGLFSNNILPIFLAAGCGYLAGKYLKVQPQPISQVAFYIFSPCLIFDLLTKSQLGDDDVFRMVGFTIVSLLTLGVLALLIGRLLRFERQLLVAFLLVVIFNNAGNYGLSLTLFAFGEDAIVHASLYFVTTAFLIYTVGVVLISMGSANLGKSIIGLFKVPVVYAVGLALFFNHQGWGLPTFADRTVSLLSSAAIPVLMVLMGVQLQHSGFNGKIRALVAANFLRLIVSPALAFGISLVFGLHGAARQAGIIESAMPTAIMTTVLATEYKVKPSFVSTVVFTTTLLSPLTVTPMLSLLGA